MLKYEDRIRDLEESVDKLKIEHRKEIDRLENNYSKNINDFEAQISKQRERTIKLINEKDAEVERFKYQNISNAESAVVASGAASSSSNYVNNEDAINNQEIIMMRSNLNETTLLHYSQELAFKDAELLKLRKLKNDLEYRIKNVISDNETELDNYRKQINLLKLEIERLKLNSTRLEASANMEYIKNVFYRFLTTKDVNVKLNMIQAIAQILQFTKHEKSKAININS